VLVDERVIEPVIPDKQIQQPVEQCDIRSDSGRKMNVRLLRSVGFARIDDDELRTICSVESVKDSCPQHRLSKGRVVAHVHDRVGTIEILIGTRIAVATEGFN